MILAWIDSAIVVSIYRFHSEFNYNCRNFDDAIDAMLKLIQCALCDDDIILCVKIPNGSLFVCKFGASTIEYWISCGCDSLLKRDEIQCPMELYCPLFLQNTLIWPYARPNEFFFDCWAVEINVFLFPSLFGSLKIFKTIFMVLDIDF